MAKEYTKNDIEKILQEHDFKYQRINLPFGLYTPGQDRSSTLNLIFPPSLEGKTVLDIGSANGYFCFEAEKRGGSRIVGIEPNEERFRHANIFKEILSSNVEFIKQDVVLQRCWDLGQLDPRKGFEPLQEYFTGRHICSSA